MRISDWSSDVCSSDLVERREQLRVQAHGAHPGGDGAQRVEAAGAGEALAAILADDLGEAQPADAARPERRKLRFVEALVRDADAAPRHGITGEDRKSTRLNSSH